MQFLFKNNKEDAIVEHFFGFRQETLPLAMQTLWYKNLLRQQWKWVFTLSTTEAERIIKKCIICPLNENGLAYPRSKNHYNFSRRPTINYLKDVLETTAAWYLFKYWFFIRNVVDKGTQKRNTFLEKICNGECCSNMHFLFIYPHTIHTLYVETLLGQGMTFDWR